MERGHAGTCYPIGQENLTWTQMLNRLALSVGRATRVVRLPTWVINIALLGVLLVHKLQGREAGLNLRYFAQLQTSETFLDPQPSQKALGYRTGDLNEAFQETVEACNH